MRGCEKARRLHLHTGQTDRSVASVHDRSRQSRSVSGMATEAPSIVTPSEGRAGNGGGDMSDNKYTVVTMDDVYAIVASLAMSPPERTTLPKETIGRLESIRRRFIAEQGADMEDIARILKKMDSETANEQGRRLGRLLARARGERSAGRFAPPRIVHRQCRECL